MLHGYFQVLFERLEFTQDNHFKSSTEQSLAAQTLGYLCTGAADNNQLALCNICCGLPMLHPAENGFTITESDKKLMEGLIKAAIGYWPAIGNASVQGFRENWLVRNGILTELEDRYELTVEKRAYDILLNHSPFSFSVLKHPWMEKPLHTDWPY
jgi:Contractile injection system tape measure protein